MLSRQVTMLMPSTPTALVARRALMSRACGRLPVAQSICRPGRRYSSHSPLGRPALSARKKVTLNSLRSLYEAQEPIVTITAHDFPSAHVADAAGMDIILVGDSLAMVALGMEDTSEVVLGEMILHCRSVARATEAAFTVCDRSIPSGIALESYVLIDCLLGWRPPNGVL